MGFCYQSAIKWRENAPKVLRYQGFRGFVNYSHSIVEGGLLVMS